MSGGVCLRGLDGSNPLAFLAALGVLRGLTLDAEARAEAAGAADGEPVAPAEPVRMWWTRERGVWTPWVSGEGLGEEAIVQALASLLRSETEHPTLSTVPLKWTKKKKQGEEDDGDIGDEESQDNGEESKSEGSWNPQEYFKLSHGVYRLHVERLGDIPHRTTDLVGSLGTDCGQDQATFLTGKGKKRGKEPKIPAEAWLVNGVHVESDKISVHGPLCVCTPFQFAGGNSRQSMYKILRSGVNGRADDEGTNRPSLEARLRASLLARWDYLEPMKDRSLRFNPLDDRQYAYQWAEPSGDKSRDRTGNMIGANALVLLALPMFPVVARGGGATTSGWNMASDKVGTWTWPIWSGPSTADVVRSLLSLGDIVNAPIEPRPLLARGIVAVHRCTKVERGKPPTVQYSFLPANSLM